MKTNKSVSKKSTEKNLKKCAICGEYHDKHEMHDIEVKDQKKYICNGCAETVHGLV